MKTNYEYIRKAEVKSILKKVAYRQINTSLIHPLTDWTNASLFVGMVEWAGIADTEDYYLCWLLDIAKKSSWGFHNQNNKVFKYLADDYCIGQLYIELYRKFEDKTMISNLKTYLEPLLSDPLNNNLGYAPSWKFASTMRWHWCDALFMAPPVFAKMSNITGKRKYLDFMYREYKATTDLLYDKEENLFYRDSRFFDKREANNQKVLWGRGNGWVFAGLPLIIRELPVDYEQKKYFVTIYRSMAERLMMLQQPDGSWHASLLDPASYPSPEMSATSFFIFGFTWGINNDYLDKETYLPVIKKGWEAMVNSVWTDGKIGFIQPIGADPKTVTREMTEVYGVGAFLLAGTEIYKMFND